MRVSAVSSSASPRVLPIGQWPLRGGAVCLDFANTVGWRPDPRPLDGIRTYEDLLVWSRLAEVVSHDEYARLSARAASERPAAAEALCQAITLREAIYRLFVALTRGRTWDEDDLATINHYLAERNTHAALVAVGEGFAYQLAPDETDLAMPHWLIAESASELLVSGDWWRVRECPGYDCGWLFLDQTKNGNRRWCDSADCGNRARVRAHQRRRRERIPNREQHSEI